MRSRLAVDAGTEGERRVLRSVWRFAVFLGYVLAFNVFLLFAAPD